MTVNVWHVYGGVDGPNFARFLVDNQMAMVGPAGPGRWSASRDDKEYDGPGVRRLASEMHVGDAVLLRTGTATVYSVGLVAGEYEYLPQFDDVHGHELPHVRRVLWARSLYSYAFEGQPFAGGTPWLGPVTNLALMDYAVAAVNSPPFAWKSATLPPLPPEEPALHNPPAALTDLVALASDLTPLYWDPVRFGEPPSEHEVVAHYAVPLLRALGWPAERIALEWRRTDIALFRRLPRTPENLYFIVEAKRLGTSVESHLQQGIDYLRGMGVERDVVVTDGLRYRLYAADQEYAPAAYANLTRLKQSSLTLFDRLKRP